MKRLLLCLLLLGGIRLAHAQYYKTDTSSRSGFDPSRMMIGGSLGLVFGDYTNINVSPLIGYRFSDLFAAGVNLNAQYASEKEEYGGRTAYRYQYTVFGGGVWGRIYPLEMLFLHAQPEYNHVSEKYTDYTVDPKLTSKTSYGVSSLLLGGGYSQPLGSGYSAFYIMVLYDVLQNVRSPYQNRPQITAGFNVGL
ncbi:hypothetical protein [uncultured Chitinophaga sp.]|jgi:hypothetical protein|uniref:hypothetical protein n=1 Tax=uncultured Chitinophaga sp. TaxID=339340 RepID=UPI0026079F12|nr:hypothetical protein [uncultured Chitinophaga sp.]